MRQAGGILSQKRWVMARTAVGGIPGAMPNWTKSSFSYISDDPRHPRHPRSIDMSFPLNTHMLTPYTQMKTGLEVRYDLPSSFPRGARALPEVDPYAQLTSDLIQPLASNTINSQQ